jgi:hypothetical protein
MLIVGPFIPMTITACKILQLHKRRKLLLLHNVFPEITQFTRSLQNWPKYWDRRVGIAHYKSVFKDVSGVVEMVG